MIATRAALLSFAVALLPPVASGCRWALVAVTPEHSGPLPTGDDLFGSSLPHSLTAQSHRDPRLPDLESGYFHDATDSPNRNHAVNLDGFGLGWFDHKTGQVKRIRSPHGCTDAARNATAELTSAVSEAKSRIIFGHIRAATVPSDGDSAADSHPFSYGPLLWMHNGGIAKFAELRAPLLRHCEEDGTSGLIAGATDSELAGAIFAGHLSGTTGGGGGGGGNAAEDAHDNAPPASFLADVGGGPGAATAAAAAAAATTTAHSLCRLKTGSTAPLAMVHAMEQLLDDLTRASDTTTCDALLEEEQDGGGGDDDHDDRTDESDTGASHHHKQRCAAVAASDKALCEPSIASSLNFAASDGRYVVATRYRTCPWSDPPSLYYSLGDRDDDDGGGGGGGGGGGSRRRRASSNGYMEPQKPLLLDDDNEDDRRELAALRASLPRQPGHGGRVSASGQPPFPLRSVVTAVGNGRALMIASEPLDAAVVNNSGGSSDVGGAGLSGQQHRARPSQSSFSSSSSSSWTLLAKDEMAVYDSETGRLELRCTTPACLDDVRHRRRTNTKTRNDGAGG